MSRRLSIIFGLLWLLPSLLLAQDSDTNAVDTVSLNQAQLDSLLVSSDSNAKPKRQSTLDYEVDYQSDDSMLVDLEKQMVYLYGNAVAKYGDIELKAAYIEISLQSNELRATGLPDSTGELIGKPVFVQGDQAFDAGEMRYNFKTQRGLSKRVKTQESGGYLHGETVKRDTGEVIYIKNGKYTTCEYDDPHFYIQASKLKVIPQDKIISGPAYLSIADIPTPLVLPFGYFPNPDRRSNGILLPSWTQTSAQGFGIIGLGYYLGVTESMDFTFTGDIYTRGGWSGNVASNYMKRYKFRGGYNVNYTQTVFSEKGYPDYSSTGTFGIRWNHTQDPKANPGSSFSASVDMGSSRAYRNNLNSTTNDFLKSQMNSSIRYQKNFSNSPFNLGISAVSSQNVQRRYIDIRAPQASLNMARVFPFKGETPRPSNSFMKKSGIEDIGIQGKAELVNRLQGQEDTLFNNYNNKMLKGMDNGLRVTSTMSTNVKFLKYITLSPSLNHKFVGYRKTFRQRWDTATNELRELYVDGLDGFYDGSASIGANTVIYGTYAFRSDVIRAMRHQVNPSVTFSYRPDYSDPFWGYYDEVQRDSIGNTLRYSFFDNNAFSDRPTANGNGVLNFSLQNTLEMKVRDRSDSTKADGEKKVKLFDQFSFNTQYRFAADSLKWQPLSIAFRTSIFKGLGVDATATLDPYARSANGRPIDQFQYDIDGRIGNWTNARLRLNYNIRPKKSKQSPSKGGDQEDKPDYRAIGYYTDFVDFSLPWNMKIAYNLAYSNNGVNENITQIIDLNGQFQLARNWQIGYRTGIDIRKQELTRTSIDIYRDLHCWEFSLGVIPFGFQERYTFQINVKPGMLAALKIPRNWENNRPERD